MPLGRLEVFARLGRVATAESMLDSAARRVEDANWRQRLQRAPHGEQWFSSFHVSQFPGDDPRACQRKLLYEMMGFPPEKPASRMLVGTSVVGLSVEDWAVGNLDFDGRLLSATTDAEHQIGFYDADHWLTGSPDLIVLPPFWNRPHLIECLDGDTLIAVADGRNGVSIRQLAAEGRDVDVYACLDGRTVVRKMRNIGLTRHDAVMFNVAFDDGSHLRCTDDHLVMLIDGSYREASKLVAGDGVMRFDSELAPYNAYDKRWRRRIWMGPNGGPPMARGDSWSWQYEWLGKRLFGDRYFPGSGLVIHHKDGDCQNDRYENLGLLTKSEHGYVHESSADMRAYRSERMKRLWAEMTDDECVEMIQRRNDSIDLEARNAKLKATLGEQTPEQLLERTRKARESLSSEERSAKTRARWAAMTADERAEYGQRISDGKRRAKARNHKVVSVEFDGFDDTFCGFVDEVENFAIVTSDTNGSLSGVVVHNCKTKDLEVVRAMKNLERSFDAAHARQCRAYVGLGNRITPMLWPLVKICSKTWRLAIRQKAVGGPIPGERPEWICRDHGAGEPCLMDLELEPLRSGSLIYMGRDRPHVTCEYLFEHDEEWLQRGLAVLRRAQEHFVADELPPHPFGGKQWSEQPCRYCDFKKNTCKVDHVDGVAKLSESNGVSWAKSVYGDFNSAFPREAVLERWRDRSGFGYKLPNSNNGRNVVSAAK